MVQIDMEMPKSCECCPIRDSVYKSCPIVPGVPAWQCEISEFCKEKRSEHCPIKEEPEKAYWFISEYEYLKCSNCGYDYYTGCESTREAEENYRKPIRMHFCPGCGRKMTRKDGSAVDEEI